MGTRALWHMYKMPSPEGVKRSRVSAFYMPYCLSVHVLTSIHSTPSSNNTHKYACYHTMGRVIIRTLLGCVHMIKLPYNHPLPMATGATNS